MINNLVDYFASEQEFYLDKVSYSRMDKNIKTKEYSLTCIDNLDAKIDNDTVRLTVRRVLEFDPEELFEMSVSFGAILKFNEEKKSDYDWEKVNLVEEFRENGQFVLGNLMSRISLLIAEITSSFGQTPIISPPLIAPKNN